MNRSSTVRRPPRIQSVSEPSDADYLLMMQGRVAVDNRNRMSVSVRQRRSQDAIASMVPVSPAAGRFRRRWSRAARAKVTSPAATLAWISP
jgi:hypothetical protein